MIWTSLKTGDLIFVSGHSHFSKIIKEVMACPFSHLAMFLLGGDIGRNDEFLAWEATGAGVGDVLLEKIVHIGEVTFFDRVMNPGAGDVCVRMVEWPDTDTYLNALVRFRVHATVMKGRPYEKNKRELVNAAFPNLGPHLVGATEDDIASVFCWECVAAAWRSMGLLPQDRPANSYAITDFLGNRLPLQRGIELGPLVLV